MNNFYQKLLKITVPIALCVLAWLYCGEALAFTRTSEASSAAESKKAASKNKTKKSSKKDEKKADKNKTDEFAAEDAESSSFLPDIYRCPECGYEQDEEGFCPDHTEVALVKIISKGKSPLTLTEYDGNEDIIVDIPLKNLTFGKEAVDENASKNAERSKKSDKKGGAASKSRK